MEIVGPVVDLISYLWTPVYRQINYVGKLRKNFEKLKEDAEVLSNNRSGLIEELKISTGKMASKACESWLHQVEEIENEITEIEESYKQHKKCIMGLCPDIVSYRSLGNLVIQALNRVRQLAEKCKFVESFIRDAPPLVVEPMELPSTLEKGSIQCNLRNLLEYMRNESVHKVGIWGMGGVGKTTLMKALNNSVEMSTTFKLVIMVTVSKHNSVANVQKDIADRLKLVLSSEESEQRSATKIFQYLHPKKFLLLLDDAWDNMDLGHVGIPNPIKQGKGSKVVLSTRYQIVCNKMETDQNLKVDVLSDEQAWDLFSRKVGDVAYSKSINPYARNVVKECGGLPLAITVLGGALRNISDVSVWRNALRELQSPASSIIRDMEDHVFKPLKFSYDQLGDSNIKHCYLYCSLYPEDCVMHDVELIEYWRAGGLMDGARGIVAAYDKGRAILNTLVQSSLLEMHGSGFYVMHDLLRDLALRIVSPKGDSEAKFLVRAGMGDRLPPSAEEWKEKECISLICNNFNGLPEGLDCPMLSTLLLQNNKELEIITDMLFQYMAGLRVLDLSNTSIFSLPSSISNLIHLRGLYLNQCYKLAMLPSAVASLKELEALQMKDTCVECLPTEIGNLTNLICLLVSSSASHFLKIPLGLISRLCYLEHLAIAVPMNNEWWLGNRDAILDEVSSLRNLTNIQLTFPKVEHLEHFLCSSLLWKEQKVLNFRFSVGRFTFSDKYIRQQAEFRQLEYRAGFSTVAPGAISQVLSQSQEFLVQNCYGTIKSLSEFGLENTKGLKKCVVTQCNTIEILANGKGLEEDILSNVEDLRLYYLPNLRNIVKGLMSSRSFANIKSLSLEKCDNLKYIFSWSMIKQLSKMESLYISNCKNLEDIFEETETVRNKDYRLHCLKFLRMKLLPKITSIDKIVAVALSSIEEIYIFHDVSIKSIPGSLVDAPKLGSITGQKKWWDEELQWENDAVKQKLQPLFKVCL